MSSGGGKVREGIAQDELVVSRGSGCIEQLLEFMGPWYMLDISKTQVEKRSAYFQ